MNFYFKSCPRCRGNQQVAEEKDMGGEYRECLQCGGIEATVLQREKRVTSRRGLRSTSIVALTITNVLIVLFAIGFAATMSAGLNRN
jgi:Zn ribbon nucleic-acid-binding protein